MNFPNTEDYRRLFEASPTPFLVLAPDLLIVGVSDSYLRATMTQRQDILGKPLFEVFPDNPDDLAATGVSNLRRSLTKVLTTGQPDQMAVQKYDVRRPAEEGGGFEERHWSPLNTPVFNEKGDLIYIIHRVEDVTAMVKMARLHDEQQLRSRELESKSERMEAELTRRAEEIKRTNAELELIGELLNSERLSRAAADKSEEANRLKSHFLASMSHELRTPLNAIVGFSGLLADEPAGQLNEKQKRFVNHIRQGADHLLQLINDILDLSKIEAGQLELRWENFYIQDALPEVLSVIQPLAMAKNIRVQHKVAAERPAYADRIRFKQILYNLLSNAVKFTPNGGQIFIDCVDDRDCLRVSVADTGIGIRSEDQQLIFEEFRQVEGAEVHQGTGLGLAITKRLVERQGGRIWVESTPGEGSRFSFTLQATGPGRAPVLRDESLKITLDRSGTKPLVLVVDDEATARELLVSYLQPAGYDVEVATTAAAALEKAQQLKPDAITLDILMPSGNGFEILVALKSTLQTANIPIIVVSVVDHRKVGFALGAADYLVKPVDRTMLLETIAKHLQLRPNTDTVLLIVDDESAALELLEATLRSAGYQTRGAQSGKAALDLLASTSVHGILLDLLMPEMDGFELLREIKRQPALREIPIFVLTAKSLTQEDIALLSREAQALIQKDGSWRKEVLEALGKSVQKAKAAGAARFS